MTTYKVLKVNKSNRYYMSKNNHEIGILNGPYLRRIGEK